MGLIYIFLLLGTIITGSVGLTGGLSEFSPTAFIDPTPTVVAPTSAVQAIPVQGTPAAGENTLQLNEIAFGTITPTLTPTVIIPTSGPNCTTIYQRCEYVTCPGSGTSEVCNNAVDVGCLTGFGSQCTVGGCFNDKFRTTCTSPTVVPTATPVSTCKAIINGSYTGVSHAGYGTANSSGSSVDISYDPANPATSSYDYSWSQGGGDSVCPGAKEFAVTGTVTETFNGICTPDPAAPNAAFINKGLEFTFSAPWTFPGGSGCVWNANPLHSVTFCAVPPTAATSYVLSGQTRSIFIPPLGDPISMTTGQSGWQWYNTEYHAPVANGQSPTYNPTGSYNFTFQPSDTCPVP